MVPPADLTPQGRERSPYVMGSLSARCKPMALRVSQLLLPCAPQGDYHVLLELYNQDHATVACANATVLYS